MDKQSPFVSARAQIWYVFWTYIHTGNNLGPPASKAEVSALSFGESSPGPDYGTNSAC